MTAKRGIRGAFKISSRVKIEPIISEGDWIALEKAVQLTLTTVYQRRIAILIKLGSTTPGTYRK